MKQWSSTRSHVGASSLDRQSLQNAYLQPRLPQLDVLRGVAVLFVILQHTDSGAWAHRIGWTGVDLFFVISGFLVAGLLLKEKAANGIVDIRRFFLRRALRIYPAFWALIAVTTLALWLSHEHVRMSALVCELFFVQNYGPGLWAHTWSLAVEEHFYLGLAFVFWLWRRPFLGSEKNIVRLFAWMLIGLVAARLCTAWLIPWRFKATLWGTHVRGEALVFGSLLAYLHLKYQPLMKALVLRYLRLLCGAAMLLLLSVYSQDWDSLYVRTVGVSALSLGYGILMLAYLYAGRAGGRVLEGLGSVGRYSYGIYLWHPVVQRFGLKPLELHGWAPPGAAQNLPLVLLCGIPTGILMTWLLDKPVLLWRERRYPPIAMHPLSLPLS